MRNVTKINVDMDACEEREREREEEENYSQEALMQAVISGLSLSTLESK